MSDFHFVHPALLNLAWIGAILALVAAWALGRSRRRPLAEPEAREPERARGDAREVQHVQPDDTQERVRVGHGGERGEVLVIQSGVDLLDPEIVVIPRWALCA